MKLEKQTLCHEQRPVRIAAAISIMRRAQVLETGDQLGQAAGLDLPHPAVGRDPPVTVPSFDPRPDASYVILIPRASRLRAIVEHRTGTDRKPAASLDRLNRPIVDAIGAPTSHHKPHRM